MEKKRKKFIALKPTETSSFSQSIDDCLQSILAEETPETREDINARLREPHASLELKMMEEELTNGLSKKQRQGYFQQVKNTNVVISGKEGTSIATYNHKAFRSWEEGRAELKKYLETDDNDPKKLDMQRKLGFEYLIQKLDVKAIVEVWIGKIDKKVARLIVQGKGRELAEKEALNITETVLMINYFLEQRGNKAMLWPGFEIILSDDSEKAKSIFAAFQRYINAMMEKNFQQIDAAIEDLSQYEFLDMESLQKEIQSIEAEGTSMDMAAS